jgi:hypothetical protein
VERPARVSLDARATLFVVWQRIAASLARELDFPDVQVGDLVVRGQLQHAPKTTLCLVQASESELIHAEVSERGREIRIDGQGRQKTRVRLLDAAGAGQRDAEEVDDLEILRGLRDEPLECRDHCRELLTLDLRDGAVIGRGTLARLYGSRAHGDEGSDQQDHERDDRSSHCQNCENFNNCQNFKTCRNLVAIRIPSVDSVQSVKSWQF